MPTFIESSAFQCVRDVYMDDDESAELQTFMARRPEAGALVPGSVRKAILEVFRSG